MPLTWRPWVNRCNRIFTPSCAVPEAPDWRERLRRSGHRLTPQRARVLEAVEQLGHATPDEVFAHVQGDGINLSTVYRTLELLNELGADGWELVSVTAASQIRSQPVIHFASTFTAGVWYHAFFKRPTQT